MEEHLLLFRQHLRKFVNNTKAKIASHFPVHDVGYTHDEVASSLSMAATALHLKNKIIEAQEDELASSFAKSMGMYAQMAALRQDLQEQQAAVEELAHMLAAREASQVNLVDTVHEFLASQSISMPNTPRDAMNTPRGSGGGNAGSGNEQLSYWQERLEAQAAASALKLRNVNSSNANTDTDVKKTMTTDNRTGDASLGENDVSQTTNMASKKKKKRNNKKKSSAGGAAGGATTTTNVVPPLAPLTPGQ